MLLYHRAGYNRLPDGGNNVLQHALHLVMQLYPLTNGFLHLQMKLFQFYGLLLITFFKNSATLFQIMDLRTAVVVNKRKLRLLRRKRDPLPPVRPLFLQ